MSLYTVYSVDSLKNKQNTQAAAPLSGEQNRLFKLPWQEAEEGHIDCFPWAGKDAYRPESRFYLLYEKDFLYALLLTAGAHEKHPRTEVKEEQGKVSEDSCLEFFLAYDPAQKNYLNIETNAAATLHAGFGAGRGERLKEPAEALEGLRIYPVSKEAGLAVPFAYDWGVLMVLPFALIRKYWPDSSAAGFLPGTEMKGNFYKCGDLTPEAHFASCFEVKTPAPDFHRPEYFGPILLA